MDAEKFNIIFDGALQDGVTRDDAETNLAKLYGSDLTELVPLLFSGKRVLLKRDLAEADADKVLAALQSAGLLAVKEIAPPTFSLLEEAMPDSGNSEWQGNFDSDEFARLTLFSFHGRLGRIRYVTWSTLAMFTCTAIMFTMTIFLLDRVVDIVFNVPGLTADSRHMLEKDILTLRQNMELLWQSIDSFAFWQNMGLFWQNINLIFASWQSLDLISTAWREIEQVFALLRNLTVLAIALTVSLLVFILSVMVRRLHDINLSGWWASGLALSGILTLIMAFVLPFVFIPVLLVTWLLTLLLCLALLLWPGSARENGHGLPEPPKIRFSDVVLAVMLVVVLVAGTLSSAQFGNNLKGKMAALQEVIR